MEVGTKVRVVIGEEYLYGPDMTPVDFIVFEQYQSRRNAENILSSTGVVTEIANGGSHVIVNFDNNFLYLAHSEHLVVDNS